MAYTPENNPYIPGDPYSYDLKWMVSEIDKWKLAEEGLDHVTEEADRAKDEADRAKDEADRAADKANDAADSASDAHDSELAAKDYADHIADPVSGIVADWLDDHITQPTTPAVDSSLTVAGAAADSKAAGDAIRDLEDHFEKSSQLFDYSTASLGYALNSSGNLTANANYGTSDFIPVDPLTVYAINFSSQAKIIAFYDVNKVFISPYVVDNTPGRIETTSPASAYFVKFSWNVVQQPDDTQIYFCEKSRELNTGEPYSNVYVKNLALGPNQTEKNPYTAGDIHFVIKVNQYVYKNATSAVAPTDNEIFDDVEAVLRLPETYSFRGKKTPLIIICHGAGYGVSSTRWDTGSDVPDFENLKNRFVSEGYAIADINGYNTTFASQSWGCPRAVDAYYRLYKYIIENYNIDPEINLYGFSMGALVAINFVNQHHGIVRSVGLGAPVMSLYDICWNSAYGAQQNWRQASAAAFDFDTTGVTFTNTIPMSAEEQTCWNSNEYLTYGYSPLKNGDPDSFINFTPLKIWSGTIDPAIDLATLLTFCNNIRSKNKQAILRPVSGAGHSICWGSNQYVNDEIVYFFNRYNMI